MQLLLCYYCPEKAPSKVSAYLQLSLVFSVFQGSKLSTQKLREFFKVVEIEPQTWSLLLERVKYWSLFCDKKAFSWIDDISFRRKLKFWILLRFGKASAGRYCFHDSKKVEDLVTTIKSFLIGSTEILIYFHFEKLETRSFNKLSLKITSWINQGKPSGTAVNFSSSFEVTHWAVLSCSSQTHPCGHWVF